MSDIVERLRAALKEYTSNDGTWVQAPMIAVVAAARAENDRLREALEQIRTELRGWGSGPAVDLAIDIASDALAKEAGQ